MFATSSDEVMLVSDVEMEKKSSPGPRLPKGRMRATTLYKIVVPEAVDSATETKDGYPYLKKTQTHPPHRSTGMNPAQHKQPPRANQVQKEPKRRYTYSWGKSTSRRVLTLIVLPHTLKKHRSTGKQPPLW